MASEKMPTRLPAVPSLIPPSHLVHGPVHLPLHHTSKHYPPFGSDPQDDFRFGHGSLTASSTGGGVPPLTSSALSILPSPLASQHASNNSLHSYNPQHMYSVVQHVCRNMFPSHSPSNSATTATTSSLASPNSPFAEPHRKNAFSNGAGVSNFHGPILPHINAESTLDWQRVADYCDTMASLSCNTFVENQNSEQNQLTMEASEDAEPRHGSRHSLLSGSSLATLSRISAPHPENSHNSSSSAAATLSGSIGGDSPPNSSTDQLHSDDQSSPTSKPSHYRWSYNHQKDKRGRKKKPKPACCTHCGISSSPEWRRGPAGPRTLCNACGIRFSKKMKTKDDDLQKPKRLVPAVRSKFAV